jgi:hypothetical protein
MKMMTVTAFSAVLISCGAVPISTNVQTISSLTPSESEVTSTPETEKSDMLVTKSADFEKAIKNSEATPATAKTIAPIPEPIKPIEASPKKTVPAPVQNFHAWVNATLTKYGVSPGPGASFRVGDTAFCGGYMCTRAERYGTSVFASVTTVSPGAIGNEFALIHEVAHQHGVGLVDTGGECAADRWTRQYIAGSIYC